MKNSLENVNLGKKIQKNKDQNDEVISHLVEYVITDSDAALENARNLLMEADSLDDIQKSAFEKIYQCLRSEILTPEFLGLAYKLVEEHIQHKRYHRLTVWILRIRTQHYIRKAKHFDFLPEFLITILEFRGLILLAEHAAYQSMLAHRTQQPMSYHYSLKRPYFRALLQSLKKIEATIPAFSLHLKFYLWRDDQFEVFGWQGAPLRRRRRKIESIFENEFLSSSRVDKIARLQFLIFKAKNHSEEQKKAMI